MQGASLRNRMKAYESVTRDYLIKRMPVIIRLDGKAFHSFTKGFVKPFDEILSTAMQDTMWYLCENIQNCVLGYTQSDEISLILVDYEKIDTESWFNNNIQKIVSISASMATTAFNIRFRRLVDTYCNIGGFIDKKQTPYWSKKSLLSGASDGDYKFGLFDSRAFNIPKEEVNNYMIWRQQDATRNSIQSLAQTLYSQKELEGISNNDLQNKMFTEKDVNWNDLPEWNKRGCCCIKKPMFVKVHDEIHDTDRKQLISRMKWVIDMNIPIFSQNTKYINTKIMLD